MNIKKTLVLSALLALVIAGAYFLYGYLSENYAGDRISIIEEEAEVTKSDGTEPEEESENSEEVSYLAPDFAVTDMDGNSVSLSDKFGKPIIVNFWASWCPPCKSEMPDFEEAFKEYGNEITFMMVNMTGGRETVESAKSFIEKSTYSFPVYFDTEYQAAMTYGVSSIPQTIFIDKDGNLTAYAQGMIDKNALDTGIGMIYNTNTTITK